METFNLTLIGEIITFFVLVWFTMRYIWPQVISAIDSRQKKIAEGLEAAERGKASLDLAQQQAIKIIQEAKKKANAIIEQSNQQALTIIEHGKVKAHEEADRILVLARSDIASARDTAQYELRKQSVTMAIMAAEKLLRSNIDAAANQDFVEKLFAEVRRG